MAMTFKPGQRFTFPNAALLEITKVTPKSVGYQTVRDDGWKGTKYTTTPGVLEDYLTRNHVPLIDPKESA